MVATIFAFNLLWDMWWPMILVAIGVGIVVGYALRGRGPDSEDPGPSSVAVPRGGRVLGWLRGCVARQ